MNQTNTILSELWTKAPNYALLILILVLHVRTDKKINDLSERMEKRFQAIVFILKDVIK